MLLIKESIKEPQRRAWHRLSGSIFPEALERDPLRSLADAAGYPGRSIDLAPGTVKKIYKRQVLMQVKFPN